MLVYGGVAVSRGTAAREGLPRETLTAAEGTLEGVDVSAKADSGWRSLTGDYRRCWPDAAGC
jgi:hypothetical protein